MVETAVVRDLYAEAEARLGRALTAAERRRDIAAIDSALEAGKERLRVEIEREKRRAIRRLAGDLARGIYRRPALEVTEEMRLALGALHDAGRRHAAAELAAAGVRRRRAFAREIPPLDPILGSLVTHLGRISLRIDREAELTDLAGASQSAIVRELDRLVPGAADAASRLVSGAFDSGLGDVFSAGGDAIGSWVYSAMMDGNTCDECEALDATEYESWDAIQAVLPGGGPNPSCYGDGRCRCMPVPGDGAPSTSSPAGDVGGGGFVVPINPESERAVALARGEVEGRFAAADQMTVGQWRAEADVVVSDLVSGSEVRKRTHLAGLDGILRDGRARSQFETGYSRGAFNPAFRAREEETMFGYAADLPPAERPIYGYLSATPEDSAIDHYGDIVLRLDPSVRERTSFTVGDSLGRGIENDLIPRPLLAPNRLAAPTHVHLVRLARERGLEEIIRRESYVEAQIHGGLHLGDIVEVVFTNHRPERLQRIIDSMVERLTAADFGGMPLAADDRRVLLGQLHAAEETQAAFERITAELDRLGIPWRAVEGTTF